MEYDVSTDEGLAKQCIASCLESNHANTLPLLEVLRACQTERPYREVEEEIDALPIMHMCHQNAHNLCDMLINCGGLIKTEIVETELDADAQAICNQAEAIVAQTAAADSLAESPEHAEPTEVIYSAEEDQPIDYTLLLSFSGAAVLADYEPSKRIRQLMQSEPEGYEDAYKQIITFCNISQKAKSDDIEALLEDQKHPALYNPQRVYAGHFISNLETVNGLTWENNHWKPTEAGLQYAGLA